MVDDGSAARCAASASGSSAKRPAATAAPSTTAMTPSTVRRERIAGQSKALTSGFGSARPEVSIDDVLGRGSRGRAAPPCAGMKSSATVQQMQPLASSTMFSSGQLSMPQRCRISPSTPTSPNSLTMSASRRPSAFASRWRTSVVFPAPRKPVTMVTGILASEVFEVAVIRRPPAGDVRYRGIGTPAAGRAATTPFLRASGRCLHGISPSSVAA